MNKVKHILSLASQDSDAHESDINKALEEIDNDRGTVIQVQHTLEGDYCSTLIVYQVKSAAKSVGFSHLEDDKAPATTSAKHDPPNENEIRAAAVGRV